MINGLTTVLGLFVLYAPLALVGLVVGMAAFVRLAPMLHPKP